MAFDIPRQRLYNQRIAQEKFGRPDQVVAWMGALQAQDEASVRWAAGLRCRDATLATIQQAVASGSIVRTWLMRGTLQLVAASDLRWMLALLGPRIMTGSARRHRQLELDQDTFARTYDTLGRVLQGGQRLTRAEIMQALERAGVSTDGQRGYHILRQAGLAAWICFGPPEDKEQTFVLLDEWVPKGQHRGREAALAELAGRYFASRGPATLQDFVWWSGLRVSEARASLDRARGRLDQAILDDQTYWFLPQDSAPQDPSPTAYLLPAYDEYYLGYKTRDAVLDPRYDEKAVSSGGVFRPMIVIEGQIVGTWKGTRKKDTMVVTPNLFRTLTSAEDQALVGAANQYGAFLGLPAQLAS
jgi:hypothetical protein